MTNMEDGGREMSECLVNVHLLVDCLQYIYSFASTNWFM